MNKTDALNNALAVFNYALWRYTSEIVSFTSNNVTYDITIQLTKADWNIEREDDRLRNVIAAGAHIQIIKQEDEPYDIYSILYFYK